jgi:hypothetical protein
MINAEPISEKHWLFKWLMHAVLVFGLITFSAQIYGHRLCNAEPVRTELINVTIVNERNVLNATYTPPSVDNAVATFGSGHENLTSLLLQEHRRITTALKEIHSERIINQRNPGTGFLLHQSAHCSEDCDINSLRG